MLSLIARVLSFCAFIGILVFSFFGHENVKTAIDLPAFLLVCFQPILILVVFQKEHLPLFSLLKRFREIWKVDNHGIAAYLQKQSEACTGPQGVTNLLKATDGHSDSTLRYAGELIGMQFSSEEIEHLLEERAENEEAFWGSVGTAVSFLAKMAPYFGMFATVIGMIQLLGNMDDFTKISGSMAMALQGTLFGIGTFVLIYSPMQNFLTGLRKQIRERNELIREWVVLAVQKTDATFLSQKVGLSSVSSGSFESASSTEMAFM